jgi:hypothetical protein
MQEEECQPVPELVTNQHVYLLQVMVQNIGPCYEVLRNRASQERNVWNFTKAVKPKLVDKVWFWSGVSLVTRGTCTFPAGVPDNALDATTRRSAYLIMHSLPPPGGWHT